jgi:septum formation protein
MHKVITGLAVLHGRHIFTHCEIARMKMRRLTTKQIDRYLLRDKPFDCAGSYRLESSGISLFESIEAADNSAISGLPLLALTRILCRLGFRFP